MAVIFPKVFTKILLLGILSIQAFLLALAICCPGILCLRGRMTEDFDVKVGSSIRIWCSLFHSRVKVQNTILNVSSENLHIEFDGRLLYTVDTLDNLTVEYFKSNATVNDTGIYQCYVFIPDTKSKRFLDSTHVSVGYEPLAIKTFSCISEEFSKLICTWEIPFNPVKTFYTLHDFTDEGQLDLRECPGILNATSCQWTLHSSPSYTRFKPTLSFLFTGHNSLGRRMDRFFLNHFEIVKPGAPLSAAFSNITESSLILKWRSPANMENGIFPPGLTYSIQYRHLTPVPGSFKEIRLYFPAEGFVEFTGLMPYTKYEFKIRCRSYDSDSDMMWSPYLTVSTRTLPDVPYWRPEIDKSSFIVESNEATKLTPDIRTITLYWKGIPAAHENGPDFHYVIDASCENWIQVQSSGNETTYSFQDMKLYSTYKFELFASNTVGRSTNSSQIVIEPHRLLNGPKDIIVEFDEDSYRIRWTPTQIGVYYTIYWCESLMPRPVRCQGPLEWLNETYGEYKDLLLSNSKNYQFAVSANTKDQSSGIFWASCHLSNNSITSYSYDVCGHFIHDRSLNRSLNILYL
ncbi:cytokine receptor-like [Stegodyphus dumicola]|uniref:cytokine receptor-like n=1 Tax=Stegodyphus dumicola TaxID=202533 RepID=UPI0015ACD47C|nr:cytokine receptor-like [Stegodyphus dumicola]